MVIKRDRVCGDDSFFFLFERTEKAFHDLVDGQPRGRYLKIINDNVFYFSPGIITKRVLQRE